MSMASLLGGICPLLLALFRRLILLLAASIGVIGTVFGLSTGTGDAGDAVRSLGPYITREYHTGGGIQDHTDYAKYAYSDAPIEDSQYFIQMDEAAVSELDSYIDNFEGWVAAIAASDLKNEFVVNYDFDRGAVNAGDYCCIFDREGDPIGQSEYRKYESYSFCFFDMESSTLFYFHSNI